MQQGEDWAQTGHWGGGGGEGGMTCCLWQMSSKAGLGLTPGGPIVLPQQEAKLQPQVLQVLGVVGSMNVRLHLQARAKGLFLQGSSSPTAMGVRAMETLCHVRGDRYTGSHVRRGRCCEISARGDGDTIVR